MRKDHILGKQRVRISEVKSKQAYLNSNSKFRKFTRSYIQNKLNTPAVVNLMLSDSQRKTLEGLSRKVLELSPSTMRFKQYLALWLLEVNKNGYEKTINKMMKIINA